MNNQFILVRHATCEHMDEILLGRAVDSSLDSRGLQEAASVARALQPHEDMLVMASPRRRAQQTAAAIAAATHAEVVTSHAIDELDFGDWAGRRFSQLAGDASWKLWNERRSSAATPAGDRMIHVAERAVHQLHRLQHSFPGRVIAIVTHAEVIRATLLHWLDAPLDGYARLAIAPASYSTVSLGPWGVRIDGINQRAPS
jgi:broad specificity phosphatase PhoE